jgi:hypothetical protein
MISARLDRLTVARAKHSTLTQLSLSDFQRLLAVHEATEQQIVHLRAQHELAEGPEIVPALLAEEDAIAATVTRLCGVWSQPTECVVTLIELRALISEHFAREEQQELSALRVQLGVRQLARMRRAVELAADAAPERTGASPRAAAPGVADLLGPDEGFNQLIAAASSYISGDSPAPDARL